MLSYKSMILMIMSFMTCIIINQFSAGARDLEPPPQYNCEAPITGVWGRSLQRGPGACKAPSQGVKGKRFWFLGVH